jgi:hypothetical protein
VRGTAVGVREFGMFGMVCGKGVRRENRREKGGLGGESDVWDCLKMRRGVIGLAYGEACGRKMEERKLGEKRWWESLMESWEGWGRSDSRRCFGCAKGGATSDAAQDIQADSDWRRGKIKKMHIRGCLLADRKQHPSKSPAINERCQRPINGQPLPLSISPPNIHDVMTSYHFTLIIPPALNFPTSSP